MTWKLLEALVAKCAGTLVNVRNLMVKNSDIVRAPSVLQCLESVTTLKWNNTNKFDVTPSIKGSIKDAFGKLETLDLLDYDPSFATVLSFMDLPALRWVELSRDSTANARPFLLANGSKIRGLEIAQTTCLPVFDLVPRLYHVVLNSVGGTRTEKLHPEIFALENKHQHLCVMILGEYCGKGKDWKLFFNLLDFTMFPYLKELMAETCTWKSTTEREIAKDPWSAQLLKRGIDLTDSNGQKWKQRLQ